jgi:hypothetical protein
LSSEQDPRSNHENFTEVKSHMQYQDCPDQQNLENSGTTSQKVLDKLVGVSENNSSDNIPPLNVDLGHQIQQFNNAPLNSNSHGQPIYQSQPSLPVTQQGPPHLQQAQNPGYHLTPHKIQTPHPVLPFPPTLQPAPYQAEHPQNLLQNSGFESSNDDSQNSSDHNQDPNLDP